MSNLDAFLTMIAVSEGTQNIGDRGYNVIVGSTPEKPILFDSYADHPRQRVRLSAGLSSSAAGRYQVLEHIYDAYKVVLTLPDFSPVSQDRIATQLIRERGAIADIVAGRLPGAIAKCASIWASLAGSPYGQHTNSMAFLNEAFQSAGGRVA